MHQITSQSDFTVPDNSQFITSSVHASFYYFFSSSFFQAVFVLKCLLDSVWSPSHESYYKCTGGICLIGEWVHVVKINGAELAFVTLSCSSSVKLNRYNVQFDWGGWPVARSTLSIYPCVC